MIRGHRFYNLRRFKWSYSHGRLTTYTKYHKYYYIKMKSISGQTLKEKLSIINKVFQGE